MIEKLDRKTLLHVVRLYDRYIMEYPETHEPGNWPVTLDEFYNNDYPLVLEDFAEFDSKVRS